MAIIQEEYYINDRKMIKTYSDDNRFVVHEGIDYIEACDPAEFNRKYTEGDKIPELETIEEDEYLDFSQMNLVK